jgi:hypothetical protein
MLLSSAPLDPIGNQATASIDSEDFEFFDEPGADFIISFAGNLGSIDVFGEFAVF